ncbi:MAG: hypothetical protein MI743_11675 [Sneathiellales bacterium]|nr:hypothetical protein [Sneathiellales bacterium]
MKTIKDHLELALAEAMYSGLFVTAGLISAALETLSEQELQEERFQEEEPEREKILSFPLSGNS